MNKFNELVQQDYSISENLYNSYRKRFGEYTKRREGDYTLNNYLASVGIARYIYSSKGEEWIKEVRFSARDKATTVESFSVECI